MAAARNVSAAASTTRRPFARSRAASLPMVVVLPVPLTPTTRTIAGPPSTAGVGSQWLASRGASSARELGRGPPARRVTLRWRRACSTTSMESSAPMSPVMRISSISSQSASIPPPNAVRSRAPKPSRDRSRPVSSASRSRSRRAASAFSGL